MFVIVASHIQALFEGRTEGRKNVKLLTPSRSAMQTKCLCAWACVYACICVQQLYQDWKLEAAIMLLCLFVGVYVRRGEKEYEVHTDTYQASLQQKMIGWQAETISLCRCVCQSPLKVGFAAKIHHINAKIATVITTTNQITSYLNSLLWNNAERREVHNRILGWLMWGAGGGPGAGGSGA